ncbi:MAG: thiamine pyrophosphate-binding protein, partial [Methanosarcinales archaeon]
MNPNLTVGEYLLQAIKKLGIRDIFGIPGDMVIRFFKLLEDDPDLNLYTLSHEPGVGFAAIGSARATQRPAVACITYGAGGCNMFNSVACAYAEKTPMIIISGGPGEGEKIKGNFLHHMVKSFDSQLKAYREVTHEAVILDSTKTAYYKIQRALSACLEYMRPVYIEIPRDMVDQQIFIPEEEENFKYIVDDGAIKEAAEEILAKINNAKLPVLLAGVETERFKLKDNLLKLAEKLNLPIVTTFLARDILPQNHTHYFGTYVGLAGDRVAQKLVEESDCLLMLGVIIADINMGIKLKRLNQENLILCISRKVFIKHHKYENVPLNLLIDELLKSEIQKKIFPFPEKSKIVINRSCKFTRDFVTIQEIIDAINWFFSEYGEMPIISDTGNCLFTTLKIKTQMVMAPAYYATMGFGTPAAIGYAITTGKRPLVLLGDGGFQMTGQEMCHCPRYGINPIFIVFNNRRWGIEQHFYPTAGFNELVNWQYAKLAEL